MRTRVTILLAAIFMISSAIPAFADHDRDHNRKEYKWNKRNPDRHDRRQKGDMRNPDRYGDYRHKGDLRNPDRYYNSKKYRDHDDDWKKAEKKWRKEANKRYKREREYMEYRHQPRYYAPPVRHAYRPLPDYYDRQFRKMVRRATRGGRDVAVWQVDDNTFVVKYLYGKRYYTQYLYPYTGRYGSRNSISVNWSPNSVWNLIPSVHLNLEL